MVTPKKDDDKKKKFKLDGLSSSMSNAERMKVFRKALNKSAGNQVAYDLEEENPTSVKKWISTGSYLLDRIICKDMVGGVPMGKIVEYSGLNSVGKSYIAMQIASNALKEGVDVVYFDTEAAVDPNFTKKILAKNGFTLNDFLYVMPDSLEFVLESIENILASSSKPTLFILDSLANCPTRNSLEQEFTPGASIGEVARMLSIAFKKLTVPLSVHGSTFLIVNQLKTNINPQNQGEKYTDPYVTPGGKAPLYMCSVRVWLTLEKGKKHFIYDDVTKEMIGSEIICSIKKSRFGTMGRSIETKFLWSGEDISFQEDEAMLSLIKDKKSSQVSESGSWTIIKYEDGTEEKVQGATFKEKMKSDPRFKSRVLQLVDSVLLR